MLAENVGGLKEAGYDHIPAALQEGLLALEAMSGRSLAPPGFRLRSGGRGKVHRLLRADAAVSGRSGGPARAVPDFSARSCITRSSLRRSRPQLRARAFGRGQRVPGSRLDGGRDRALRIRAAARSRICRSARRAGGDVEVPGPRQRGRRSASARCAIQVKTLAPQPQTGADSAAWDPETCREPSRKEAFHAPGDEPRS